MRGPTNTKNYVAFNVILYMYQVAVCQPLLKLDLIWYQRTNRMNPELSR